MKTVLASGLKTNRPESRGLLPIWKNELTTRSILMRPTQKVGCPRVLASGSATGTWTGYIFFRCTSFSVRRVVAQQSPYSVFLPGASFEKVQRTSSGCGAAIISDSALLALTLNLKPFVI